jgi:hypothetical protein
MNSEIQVRTPSRIRTHPVKAAFALSERKQQITAPSLTSASDSKAAIDRWLADVGFVPVDIRSPFSRSSELLLVKERFDAGSPTPCRSLTDSRSAKELNPSSRSTMERRSIPPKLLELCVV